MENRYEHQQDFLWFSYFGITKEDAFTEKDLIRKDALLACIIRAYRDLCRSMEYRFSSEKLKKADKENNEIKSFLRNKEAILAVDIDNTGSQSAVVLLYKQIAALINQLSIKMNDDQRKKLFDDWHCDTCENLRTIVNNPNMSLLEDNASFSYGQAQKWVNLTIKNMYVMGLWPSLYGIEEHLHITIDSYILKAASMKNNIKNKYALRKPIAPKEPNGEESSYSCTFYSEEKGKKSCPWSKLNKTDYLRLQCAIRRAIKTSSVKEIHEMNPFEWETKAWIAQARIENK